MKLSPISIKRQEFNKSMRGYNADEVQAFLERLADEVEELQQENETIKKELEEANFKVNEYRRIEKNLQDTLLRAHESSSKAIESTKKQTSLMMKEAEIKASQLLEKARENTNEIRNAIINLREEKDLLVAKLKAMISSQANLLEMKVEDAGAELYSSRKSEPAKKLDVDIDDIVNKLL